MSEDNLSVAGFLNDEPAGEAAQAVVNAGTTQAVVDTGTTTTSPWDSLQSEELKILAGKKGWKTTEDALISYQNLERMERVALPKEGDQASFDSFYNKLGRPETVEGYTLDGVQGLPENADTSLFDALKATFHETGITAAQSQKLALAASAAQSKARADGEATFVANFNREMADMSTTLGVDGVKQLKQDARLAAQGYGIELGEIDALAKVLGPKRAFETLQKLGKPLREGKVISGDSAPAAFSGEFARSELSRLLKDPVQGKLITSGDKAAMDYYNKVKLAAFGS